MKKTDKNELRNNAFSAYVDLYSPKIDMSIGKFLRRKKKSAPFGFMHEIYDVLEEYCLRKGKRVRPVLLIIGYLGYGGEKRFLKDIIALASALELMHCFLLVQDDIIDRSEERRGDKSLHLVFQEKYKNRSKNKSIGSDVALVAADVLFTCALEMVTAAGISPALKQEFMMLFGRTYEMTACGQILDSLNTLPASIPVDKEAALQISLMKTAYYTVYYPLLMGYVLAGGNLSAEKKLIKKCALHMGLAFQLRDDILGTFGKKEKTGKPTDSDIIEGKLTYLIQYALINLDEKEKKRFFKLFTEFQKKSQDIAVIKKMIQQSGALEAAIVKYREEVRKAETGINKTSADDKAKSALHGFLNALELPL